MRVIITALAQRDLDRLSSEMSERVVAALRALRSSPRPPGCLLLHDRRPPTWRIRVGDWRVLYEIDDSAGVIVVTGVHHRSKAY